MTRDFSLLVTGSNLGEHIVERRNVLPMLCHFCEKTGVALSDILEDLKMSGSCTYNHVTFQAIR